MSCAVGCVCFEIAIMFSSWCCLSVSVLSWICEIWVHEMCCLCEVVCDSLCELCEFVSQLYFFGLHVVCGLCVLIFVFCCHGCAVCMLIDVLFVL